MLPTNIAMLRNNFNAQMHDLADNMFTAAKKRWPVTRNWCLP